MGPLGIALRVALVVAQSGTGPGGWWATRGQTTPGPEGEVTAKRDYARTAPYDGGFLALWEDSRRNTSFVKVFGARLDTGGRVLDPRGLEVATGPLWQWDPAAACIDSQCLIVWTMGRAGIGARFLDTVTGALSPTFVVNDTPGPCQQATVATDGARYLVAWADPSGVYSRLVGPQGQLVTAEELVAARAGRLQFFLTSAWTGGTYLVAWLDDDPNAYRVRYRAMSAATGAPTAAAVSLGRTSRPSPVGLASSGAGFALAWASTSLDAVGRLVGQSGALVSNADLTIQGGGDTEYVGLAYDGTAYVASMLRGGTRVELVRLGAADLVPNAAPVSVRTSTNTLIRAYLSAQGPLGLATHTVDRGLFPSLLESVLFSTAGGAPQLLDAGLLTQTGPSIPLEPRAQPSAGGYLLLYSDYLDLQGRPRAVRTDLAGGNAWELPDFAPPTPGHVGSALGAGGGVLHQTWSDGDTAFARVDLETAQAVNLPLAPSSSTFSAPAVGVSEDAAFYAWGGDDPGGLGLFFRQWERGRGLLGDDAGVLIRTSRRVVGAAVAGVAGNGLVAWSEDGALHVSRLGADGGLLDGEVNIAPAVHALAVAGSDGGYLLVWCENEDLEVHGAHVYVDGGALDWRELTVANLPEVLRAVPNSTRPDVAFADGVYHVAWTWPALDGGTGEVLTRTVSPAGQLGAVEVVATGLSEPERVHLSALPGRTHFSWTDFDPDAGAVRAFGRVRAQVAAGDACVGDSECLSGTCVAGACCPTGAVCTTLGPDGGVAGGGSGGSGGGPAGGSRSFIVGCGCGASGAPGGVALFAAFLATRRSARRRSSSPSDSRT